MELRLALINEVELLTNMSKDAFNTDYLIGGDPNDGPPDYDNVNWHMNMCNEKHLFSYLDGDILVGGAVLFENNNKLYVGRIFIDPKYFKKGYGYSLMMDIEKYYDNCNEIDLDTPIWNVRTNSLYIKCGYQEVNRDIECVSYKKVK